MNKEISILLSVTKIENISDLCLSNRGIKSPTIVISQLCNSEKCMVENNVYFHSYKNKGLSKSRNLAIKAAKSEWGIITDDDIVFKDDYLKIVTESIKKYPDSSFFTFNVRRGKNIIGSNKEFKHNLLTINSVSSVQLVINLSKLKEKEIKFNESFGLGSKYISGEENLLLNRIIKSQLHGIHIPKEISIIKDDMTTGEIWTDNLIFSKGAYAAEFSHVFSCFIILYFILFKYTKYKENYSIMTFTKIILKGWKERRGENEGF